MNAPSGDDLERRLTELFQQRAARVTQARQVDLGSENSNRTGAATGSVRFGRLRENRGWLVAAAVIVMITGLGIQVGLPDQGKNRNAGVSAGANNGISGGSGVGGPGHTAGPRIPTGPSCPAPASWRQAIGAGAFLVDRSLTKVVSANGGTGDYLAIQVNKPASENPQVYSNIKVTLFHGSTGTTLYTPEGHDDVHSDPSGAISADWVTFAVTRLRVSSFTYKVMLYDRGAGVTRTLVESHQQTPQGKRLRGSPVIADGKVYWLASISNRPETTTLESWDLAQNSAAGSVPAAGATGLVSYGSGVALINEEASQATLSNGAGAPLARSQLVSARGSHFGFDGRSKLTWLRRENGSIRYFYLVVGGTSVSNLRLHTEVPASDLPLPTYPFLATEANSQYSLFDMRARGGISLPKGVSLQAVVGDKVIFGTGTTPAGAAGLSVVRLSASPPAGC